MGSRHKSVPHPIENRYNKPEDKVKTQFSETPIPALAQQWQASFRLGKKVQTSPSNYQFTQILTYGTFWLLTPTSVRVKQKAGLGVGYG